MRLQQYLDWLDLDTRAFAPTSLSVSGYTSPTHTPHGFLTHYDEHALDPTPEDMSRLHTEHDRNEIEGLPDYSSFIDLSKIPNYSTAVQSGSSVPMPRRGQEV